MNGLQTQGEQQNSKHTILSLIDVTLLFKPSKICDIYNTLFDF